MAVDSTSSPRRVRVRVAVDSASSPRRVRVRVAVDSTSSLRRVRVRFAPSPTGPLHLGGARTALFNYLFARNPSTSSGRGVFLLRFEDTDQARSKTAFKKEITESLRWAGLTWDEEYHQSQRLALYRRAAAELLKKGAAYRDGGALYFHIPANREIVFDDLIRGRVKFETKDLKDFVLLKRNGRPTFHFANVVDDAAMKISHVIRGEDHLSNTPLHLLLYEALGAKPPRFAHIPLILNADRSKMSKRTGEVNLSAYIEAGYLPEAMINFLAQLGWSAPNGQEIFDLKYLLRHFDLNRVQKAGAVFDRKLLEHLNHYYLRRQSANVYARLALPYLKGFKADSSYKKKVALLYQDRAKVLSELPELAHYLFRSPTYQGRLLVFARSNKAKTRQGLEVALATLQKLRYWNEKFILKSLEQAVAREALANGDLFWPLRVALSGERGSPPPEALLKVMGRTKALKRIKQALAKLRS